MSIVALITQFLDEEDAKDQQSLPTIRRNSSPRAVTIELKSFEYDKILQLKDGSELSKLKTNIIMNLLSNDLLNEDELKTNTTPYERIDIISRQSTSKGGTSAGSGGYNDPLPKTKKEIYNSIQNLPLFLTPTSYSFIIHGSSLNIHLGMDIYLRIVDANCIKQVEDETRALIWSCVYEAYHLIPLSTTSSSIDIDVQ